MDSGAWAHPQALILVVSVDPGLLQGGEALGQAEGVPVVDLFGLGVDVHHNEAGISIGDDELDLRQDRPLQVVHVWTGVDMVDNLVVKQEIILFHGGSSGMVEGKTRFFLNFTPFSS